MILGGATNLRRMNSADAQNLINNQSAADAIEARERNNVRDNNNKQPNGKYFQNPSGGLEFFPRGTNPPPGYTNPSTESSYKPDLYEDLDGNLQRLNVNEDIPAGWKKAGNNSDALMQELVMQGRKLTLGSKLAGYESVLMSGRSGGKEVSSEDMQIYANLYNSNSKDFEFVPQPDPVWYDKSRTKLVKVPKQGSSDSNAVFKNSSQQSTPTINTQAEYDALPVGTTYIDSQDGKTYIRQ